MNEQICYECGKTKPLTIEFFPINKRMKNGFNGKCRECRTRTRTDRTRNHWNEDLLLCLRCGEYKEINEFDARSENIHRQGKTRHCKKCVKQVAENRRICARGKEDIDTIIQDRWWGLFLRAKKKGWVVDFDKAYLKELWEKQEGKCAVTQISMTFKLFTGRVPTNMSVDRIDSEKGYIKGNIQLVCMAVNQMKSDMDMETLLYFCREILDHAE